VDRRRGRPRTGAGWRSCSSTSTGSRRSTTGSGTSATTEALAEPVEISGRPLPVGATVGVACHPRDGTDPRALLARADRDMYARKPGRG
jgi:predicted signal transduction protein with EAL and GGDEF domain